MATATKTRRKRNTEQQPEETGRRHPGRRKPADSKTEERHKKLIIQAEKKRRDLEKRAETQVEVLAKRIDTAAQAGVETKKMAEWLGISRQMIYKLVRERVDGVPLSNPKASKNGSKSG